MDRKRNKKIIKYLKIYLAFFSLFSFFMLVLAGYEMDVNRRRILSLMESQPDLEAEIIAAWKNVPGRLPADGFAADSMRESIRIMEEKYGYSLSSIAAEPFLWVFWGSGLLIGTLCIVVSGYLDLRMGRRDMYSSEKLQELYECLEQFRNEEFEYVPDYEEDFEEWMKICESLRELGVYFSGLKERLEKEENSTKALITNISHQLKTPLAALKITHELAAGGQLSPFPEFSEEEKRDFFKQEEQEIEKLELLLNELVKLSRLETHMIQIKPAAAGFRRTLMAAVSPIYIKAKNKHMEMDIEMDKDIQVFHDAKWTEEALANVLDNAVKYSEEHTRILVRVIPLVSNVLVEIEDEGIGIKAEELTKIFQRFYRGTQAGQKVKEGAGVGLYLARMILERQGGTISARRKAKNGTIFQITLPIAKGNSSDAFAVTAK